MKAQQVLVDGGTHAFSVHDFTPKPGKVVDPKTILSTRNGHEDVLAFKDRHLWETTPLDDREYWNQKEQSMITYQKKVPILSRLGMIC